MPVDLENLPEWREPGDFLYAYPSGFSDEPMFTIVPDHYCPCEDEDGKVIWDDAMHWTAEPEEGDCEWCGYVHDSPEYAEQAHRGYEPEVVPFAGEDPPAIRGASPSLVIFDEVYEWTGVGS